MFQENQLTKAIQLFDKEKYAEAEQIFKKLLSEKPDDFMINYFYGACRTENGHYSDEDLGYLLKASKEVTPLNIDYYFAVQYHAKNQWEKALAYYKLYKTVASANEQEKAGLVQKMEQCTNQINPFAQADSAESKKENEISAAVAAGVSTTQSTVQTAEKSMVPAVAVIDSSIAKGEENTGVEPQKDEWVTAMDSSAQDTVFEEEQVDTEQEAASPIPAEEQIVFSVNDEITYLVISNFRTEEGRSFFKDGNEKQNELEKVTVRTEILREKYKNAKSRAEKDSTGQLILTLENQAYDLRKEATQLLLTAKNAENNYWQNATVEEKEQFIDEISNLSKNSENTAKEVEVLPDSPVLIMPPVLTDDEQIRTPATKEKPSGITYKIQLGAYSRGIPNNMKAVFNKISILRKVENYTDENGVVVYTTGNLTNYDDAVVMQKQIMQEGIKDPKIAAYLNGKRITLEQAKELDKNR